MFKKWFLGLWSLLQNTQGQTGDEKKEENTETETETETEEETETQDTETETEEETEDTEISSKKTERTSRFNEYKRKSEKVEKLIELGILSESEDGELRINPKALEKPKEEGTDGKATSFRFGKDEVDDKSWPLVEKINKAYDHYDKQVSQVGFALSRIFAELSTLREFPESIAKDTKESPNLLKKKAMEILKNDEEFKRSHRGDPEAIYWAFKRAADILAGKNPQKSNPKPKGSFIVGRGDMGGKSGKLPVDRSKWTKEQWDKAEQEEAKRLAGVKK